MRAREAQHGEAADKEDETGAGDQGMVFGYACNETSTLMPMPIYLAHRLSERLTEVRKNGTLPFLRPDLAKLRFRFVTSMASPKPSRRCSFPLSTTRALSMTSSGRAYRACD